ncbi:tetratricopeptide repeat protein [Amycolatopsis alba]|nr:tetratricopeptide repeat protein [Amycolatopsis alba]
MNKPLTVTSEQVAAAKLQIVLDRKRGQASSEIVRRIAATTSGNVGVASRSASVAGQPPANLVDDTGGQVVELSTGHSHVNPTSLANLADALRAFGRHDEALATVRQAHRDASERHDRFGESKTLRVLGTTLNQLGRYKEAIDAHSQALLIARQLGHLHGEVESLIGLGDAWKEEGRLEEALDAFQRAADFAHELDSPQTEAETRVGLGRVLQTMGRHDEALTQLRKALDLHQKFSERTTEETSTPVPEV